MITEFEYFLEVISAESKGKTIPLSAAKNLIGRSELHFDASVSREHFVLKSDRDGFYLRDLGAANRTVLNGARIESERDVEIKIGDTIRVGQTRLRLIAREKSLKTGNGEPQEMPYVNKAEEIQAKVAEPDKRGLEINIGTMGTSFDKAVGKFRKLSKFSPDQMSHVKEREVRRIEVDLEQIHTSVSAPKKVLWPYLVLIVTVSAAAASYLLN